MMFAGALQVMSVGMRTLSVAVADHRAGGPGRRQRVERRQRRAHGDRAGGGDDADAMVDRHRVCVGRVPRQRGRLTAVDRRRPDVQGCRRRRRQRRDRTDRSIDAGASQRYATCWRPRQHQRVAVVHLEIVRGHAVIRVDAHLAQLGQAQCGNKGHVADHGDVIRGLARRHLETAVDEHDQLVCPSSSR